MNIREIARHLKTTGFFICFQKFMPDLKKAPMYC